MILPQVPRIRRTIAGGGRSYQNRVLRPQAFDLWALDSSRNSGAAGCRPGRFVPGDFQLNDCVARRIVPLTGFFTVDKRW